MAQLCLVVAEKFEVIPNTLDSITPIKILLSDISD